MVKTTSIGEGGKVEALASNQEDTNKIKVSVNKRSIHYPHHQVHTSPDLFSAPQETYRSNNEPIGDLFNLNGRGFYC